MDKILASKLMKDLLSLGEHLNKIAHQIEAIEVEEEKLQFRRGISDLMDGVYGDLMRPIIRDFPELSYLRPSRRFIAGAPRRRW